MLYARRRPEEDCRRCGALPAKDELNIERFRALAEHAGLQLSDSELRELLVAALRTRRRALALRALVSDEDEPATRFAMYPAHAD